MIFSLIYFAFTQYKVEGKEVSEIKSESPKIIYSVKKMILIPGGTFWKNLNSNNTLNIVDKFVSWGYKTPSLSRSIDTIIIHSSYDALGDNPYSVKGVIYEYKIYGVSPHYLIDRNGTIFRLVKEENIAFHAGRGKMPDNRTNINNFSIGIEIINTKTVGPNELQYLSLVRLVKFLKSKYEIKNILGHNEISPERKTDPWNFDWQKFNEMLKTK